MHDITRRTRFSTRHHTAADGERQRHTPRPDQPTPRHTRSVIDSLDTHEAAARRNRAQQRHFWGERLRYNKGLNDVIWPNGLIDRAILIRYGSTS
jgi:hypothetical protein